MAHSSETTKMIAGQWLMHVLHGALIGVGAILPGVSGGVMCVLFGIYQPMMALLSHPGKAFRQYYRLFIPVLIGCAIGFVGLSKVVELAFGADSAIVTCLFFGLILGTIPSLWREAGLKGRNARCGWAFGLSFVILLGLLSLFKFSSAAAIQPNSGWYFFCGAVWGLSLVLPGLSSSSILIFMGLYSGHRFHRHVGEGCFRLLAGKGRGLSFACADPVGMHSAAAVRHSVDGASDRPVCEPLAGDPLCTGLSRDSGRGVRVYADDRTPAL